MAKRMRNSSATMGPEIIIVYGRESMEAPRAQAARFMAEEKIEPVFGGALASSASPAHVTLVMPEIEVGRSGISISVGAGAGVGADIGNVVRECLAVDGGCGEDSSGGGEGGAGFVWSLWWRKAGMEDEEGEKEVANVWHVACE